MAGTPRRSARRQPAPAAVAAGASPGFEGPSRHGFIAIAAEGIAVRRDSVHGECAMFFISACVEKMSVR
jgi:hypothetical protein